MIGLGAWEAGGDAWGANPADEDVVRAFHAAFDAGITWVDTAEVYGSGESERLVGKALDGRRDDVVVATKVAPSPEGTICCRPPGCALPLPRFPLPSRRLAEPT